MTGGATERWERTYHESAGNQIVPLQILGCEPPLTLTTDQGQPLLDFTAGNGLMPLGHRPPNVMAGVAEVLEYFNQVGPWGQVYTGIQSTMLGELSAELPQRRFTLYPSETEALAAAVRTVKREHFRQKMAAGKKLSGGVGTQLYWLNGIGDQVTGVEVFGPGQYHFLDWEAEAEDWPDQLAGILISPVNADTYEQIPTDVLQAAISYAAQAGLPIIWDDTVLGGFGLDSVFSTPRYAHYAVLGGGLAAGLPFGAVANVRDVPDPSEPRRQAGSAAVSAAVLHSVRELRDGLLQDGGKVKAMAERLDHVLNEVVSQHQLVDRAVGEGLLRGLQLVNEGHALDLSYEMRKYDVLVALPAEGTSLVRMAVAPVHQLESIELLANALHSALDQMER